jgi:predicted MFS family arabinose efflux permease
VAVFSHFFVTHFSFFQLIVISIAAHIALAGARVTSSLHALSLHASELTIGLLIALFALFPMLFGVTMGRLIDRIGIKRPMRLGCLAIALGCALSGMGGLLTLFFAVPLIGTGFMAVHIGSQHAVGFSASSFLGPVMAGLLIDHIGFSTSYFVCCGFALLALGLIASGHLDHIHLHAHPQPAKPRAAFDLLHEPEMRRIYFASLLLAAAWDLFTYMTPIQGSKMGLSASMIGLIFGAFSAATFAVRLAMPPLQRRFSEWQVLTGALTLAMCCYLALPFAQHAWSLMAIAAVLGLALGSSQPNVLALLHQAAPAGRGGEAIGVRATIGNGSQVFLPLAVGAVGLIIGPFGIFWGMSTMIASGIAPAWRKASAHSKSAPTTLGRVAN